MSEPTRRSEDEDSELHFTRLSGEPVAEPPAVMRLDDPAVDAELPKPKRRWRGRLIALGLLVGLGALVWYAPLLAVAGPWRSAAIGAVLPPLNGTLTVEQAQLGWNAPIRLQG
ncbi:MAG TPA: hypothetical protein VGE52_18215, partial [Pirellulales bacterium]